jgi:hypothetical protein
MTKRRSDGAETPHANGNLGPEASLSSPEETPVEHPIRNFLIVVALLVGAAVIVNVVADMLQQVETRGHNTPD